VLVGASPIGGAKLLIGGFDRVRREDLPHENAPASVAATYPFPDRLMVGSRTLNPKTLVRPQLWEPIAVLV
jgi:hypothetical protein